MAHKRLKIAWILGGLLCLAILTTHVELHVAKPVVIRPSGSLKDLDINGIVKENIPDIQLQEPSGPGWPSLFLVALILGGLIWYTRRPTKEG